MSSEIVASGQETVVSNQEKLSHLETFLPINHQLTTINFVLEFGT